ncbi:MAG: carboxypeptidase-like regulatory domain-containing protein [Bacteroidia bacterium]|nr:carboxypeptidase-like regulatory domain-containing protein [Bacteroidia bacterium]
MNKFLYTAFLLLLPLIPLKSQLIGYEKFVQLSGIITDKSYRPVQGVAVISKKLHRAAISENTGIYSITSTPGDTIFFRAIGFKRYHTVIPENYQARHCTVDIVLETDTIMISEVKILPWKTYTEFLAEVTKEKPPDPKIEYMNENLASIYVAISNDIGVGISPEAGFRYATEQNFIAMTNRNMAVPYNNLFNPLAWVKFINGAKHGLLRNKTFEKPGQAKVVKKKKKSARK